MREILFRGKRVDNGEWVVGSLLWLESGRAMIIPSHTNIFGCDIDDMDESIIQTVAHRVIPETVGQYTGLTDKNGAKIFEGDIVKEYLESLKEIGFNKGFDFGKVFWYSKDVQFLRTSKVFIDDAAILSDSHKYEVISNIHDNPELLEGVRNEVNNNESN